MSGSLLIHFIPYYSNIGRRTRTGARIDHNPLYNNFPGNSGQETQRQSSVTRYRIAVTVLSTAFLLALAVIALLSMKQIPAQSKEIKQIQIQQSFLGKYQRKYRRKYKKFTIIRMRLQIQLINHMGIKLNISSRSKVLQLCKFERRQQATQHPNRGSNEVRFR